jgi:hypothetical protein
MSDRNQQNRDQNLRSDDMTKKGAGKQGIDKAPGEETSRNLENPIPNTLKGKNKEDGDPSKESDQPISLNKE